MAGSIKLQIDFNLRNKINNLVISRVYARDVLKIFREASIATINDFLWQVHLKFYLHKIEYVSEEEKKLNTSKTEMLKSWIIPPKWCIINEDPRANVIHFDLNMSLVSSV